VAVTQALAFPRPEEPKIDSTLIGMLEVTEQGFRSWIANQEPRIAFPNVIGSPSINQVRTYPILQMRERTDSIRRSRDGNGSRRMLRPPLDARRRMNPTRRQFTS